MAKTATNDATPAKTPIQEAVEQVIALKAPGKVMSQLTVGNDATGEPNMIVIYLAAPVA